MYSLGWAPNDLDPHNAIVNEEGTPAPIDFESACELDVKLGTSWGTKWWIDVQVKNYHASDKSNDISALEKIPEWLSALTFDD